VTLLHNAIRRVYLFSLLIFASTVFMSEACAAEITQYRAVQTRLAGDETDTAARVIVNASRQVYRILVELDGEIRGGTAFLVSGSRVVATNNHVVDRGIDYALGYVGERGQIRWVKLQIMAVFPQKDLALLLASEDLPGEPFSLAAEFPELASDLYAIGFPAAADLGNAIGPLQTRDRNFFAPSVVKGTVSRIMSGIWLTHQLQHQTPISAGYSGGPLVDRRGIVVGVSSAIHKDASGIAYGVGTPDLTRLLSACSLTPRVAHLQRFATVDLPPVTHAPAEAKQQEPSFGEAMVRRAYDMLGRGDIAGARTTFDYAARVNNSREALEGLAKSYDPHVLKSLRVFGDLGDAKKAEEFYEQAQRVDSINIASAVVASRCDNDLCVMQEEAGGAPVVRCAKTRSSASVWR
jgi:S1-C subfamily serine protease